jgi:uncharacterized membrane protein YqaE (UPF0057 family)
MQWSYVMHLFLIALLLPPIAVLLLQKPLQAILNLLLYSAALLVTMVGSEEWLLLILLSTLHALIVLWFRRGCINRKFKFIEVRQ